MRHHSRFRARPAVRRYRSPSRRGFRSPAARRRRLRALWMVPAGLVVAALLGGTLWLQASSASSATTWTVLSTAPTHTDGAWVLPAALKRSLKDLSLENGSLELYRADGDGDLSAMTALDLTPVSPSGREQRAPERRVPAAESRVAAATASLQAPSVGRGGRSLFAALQHLTVRSGSRLLLVSSGLDTRDPVDFRGLAWTYSPARLVSHLREEGGLPDLRHAHVTMLLTPVAGDQQQLTQRARTYRQEVWTAILTAAGADSVAFADAPASTGKPAGRLAAPTIALPAASRTPRPCTIGATAFRGDHATFLHRDAARRAVARCVADARSALSITVDAWTALTGTSAAARRADLDLSQDRGDAVRDLLVEQGVPAGIVQVVPHGSDDQPDSAHPRSAANRIARVTVYLSD